MRKIHHYFIPHPENNHKAHALNPRAFLVYFFLILFLPLFFGVVGQAKPEILGIFSKVTTEDVYSLVNKEREKNGLPPLKLDGNLNAAAQAKGQDMLAKSYWAHISPEGKTPWVFIQGTGYQYQVAGENLARNFEDSQSLVAAWMASPSHRRNVLDPDFQDEGLAVLEGNYGGKNTVLVVQMFGKPKESYTPVATKQNAQPTPIAQTPPPPAPATEVSPPQTAPAPVSASSQVTGLKTEFLVNPMTATKSVVDAVVLFVVMLFILDSAFLIKRKVIRVSGNHMAHFALLIVLVLVLWYTTAGTIL